MTKPNRGDFRVGDRIRVRRRGKKGKFVAEYSIHGDHCRRALETTDPKEAKERAEQLLATILFNRYAKPVKLVKLSDAIELFLQSRRSDGAKPKTISKYGSELNRVAAFAAAEGVTTPDRITPLFYDRYRAVRTTDDGISPRTAWDQAFLAKQFLEFLVERNVIVTNPLGTMRLRAPRRNKHPAATLEQVEAILELLKGRMLALVMTLAFTGMRRGEGLALLVEHVDLAGSVLRVVERPDERFKTANSARTIPIHARLLPVLKEVVGDRKRGLMFLRPDGRPFIANAVSELFTATAAGLGYDAGRNIQGLTLHSLRRFFKTSVYDAGVPKPLVDRWLGHAGDPIDHAYYDTKKQAQWMEKLPFGSTTEAELKRLMEM